MFESLKNYRQAVDAGKPAELDEEVAYHFFASQFRDSVIWAYKSSEAIGERVLWRTCLSPENISAVAIWMNLPAGGPGPFRLYATALFWHSGISTGRQGQLPVHRAVQDGKTLPDRALVESIP